VLSSVIWFTIGKKLEEEGKGSMEFPNFIFSAGKGFPND
jgi:hypothetical protein